jgi:hypothetical protein
VQLLAAASLGMSGSSGHNTRFTHATFAFRREGKRMQFGRWLEIGAARQEQDGKNPGPS